MKLLSTVVLAAAWLLSPTKAPFASAHQHQHEGFLRDSRGRLLGGDNKPSRACRTKELSKEERKNVNKKYVHWKKKNQLIAGRELRQEGVGPTKTVPTIFHIIAETDGGEGSEAIDFVDAQMEVLNEAFKHHKFQFELAQTPTITANRQWYKVGKYAVELEMKDALRVGDGTYLNVYVNTADDSLGWAYFPTVLSSNPTLDGVVLDYRTMPGGSCAPDAAACDGPNPSGCCEYAYNLGMTLVHEVGHWLMLAHVFDGNSCDCVGDLIDDTPGMASYTRGCPIGKDTCPDDPGLDPIHNYMDYSEDACYEEFTDDQQDLMHFAWEVFRETNGDPGTDYPPDIPDASPCVGNNNADGKEFVIDLLTDNYGEESLWDLVDVESDSKVLSSSGGYLSNTAYDFGPYCLQPGSYRFDFFDLYGDGICCGYGDGVYTLFLDGEEIFEGGDFFDDCAESFAFEV